MRWLSDLRLWLVIGLLLRVAIFTTASFTPSGDMRAYLSLAQSLIDERGLVTDSVTYGRIQAVYPPLYPLVLAGVGSFLGVSYATAALLNAALDLVSARLLSTISKPAAALFFCWPTLVLNSVVPQKESLEILIVLSLAIMACKNKAVPFGVMSGLLLLTQPALLFFPPALWLMFRCSGALPAICATVVTMSPWWIRNFILFGQFVPLTTSGGLSLAVAVSGGFHPPPSNLSGLSEPARSAAVGKMAMAQIARDPLTYLGHVGDQLLHTLRGNGVALKRLSITSELPRFAANELHLALIAVAAFGRDRFALRVVGAGLLSLVPAIFFEFAQRHLYFLIPFLIPLALEAVNVAARQIAPRRAHPHGVDGVGVVGNE